MYNRDYLENEQTNNQTKEKTNIQMFLMMTYQLLAASLLAAATGAYFGIQFVEFVSTWKWVFLVVEIALIFVISAVKHKSGFNLLALFAFTFISGLTLGPILNVALSMTAGASIVTQAFLMSSIAFGSLSLFALTTKKDFGFLGKGLFIALIILVVASLSNLYFQSSLLSLSLSGVAVFLFSMFIVYDTQNIIKGMYETPIEACLSLYLNFLNLFVSLLRLLIAFNSSDD